jgi:hypothetical protein
MKSTQSKVNLAERYIIARCNRILEPEGRKLRKNKPARSGKRGPTPREKQLGKFYVIREDRVLHKHLDLEKFAREIGALKPHEALAKE